MNDEISRWLALFVLPHEPALRAYLRGLGLPPGVEVDDLVQECYGRLAQLGSVTHIANPRAYAFATARSLLLMHVRRARIVPFRSLEGLTSPLLPIDPHDPEAIYARREQLGRLQDAIAALGEPNRSILLMRLVQDLPHGEIGRRLGLSPNAIQKALARIIRDLGRRLEPSAAASHTGGLTPPPSPQESEHARAGER